MKFDNLTIHIEGDIAPETISAGELADLLKNLEGAIVPIATLHSSQHDQTVKLCLTSVLPGTLSLTFPNSPLINEAAQQIAGRFSNGNIADLPEISRRAIQWLGRWSRKYSYTVDWLIGNRKLGSITPELDLKIESAPLLRGSTTLSGIVHSVGGERPSFKVRLPNGELQTCACSEDLAKNCGKYLYRKVVVTGEAAHNVLSNEIQVFSATTISLIDRKIGDTFRSIRDQFGQAFDTIDPKEFMTQVRGD